MSVYYKKILYMIKINYILKELLEYKKKSSKYIFKNVFFN